MQKDADNLQLLYKRPELTTSESVQRPRHDRGGSCRWWATSRTSRPPSGSLTLTPTLTLSRALDLALGPRPNRNPKQAAEHLTIPQNAFTNRLARPLLQNFFRCAGQICSALRRTIPFMAGGASKKAAGKKEKYKKHAARRGGSGTQGAVAQFSTGRR